MRISQILTEGLVSLKLKGADAKSAIEELVGLVHAADLIDDPEYIAGLVLDRERVHPTGIGRGVAIPHARVEELDRIVIAAGRHPKGIEFKARDGSKATIVFLILAPLDDTTIYLQALSSLAMMMTLGDLPEDLHAVTTPADFIRRIEKYEEL